MVDVDKVDTLLTESAALDDQIVAVERHERSEWMIDFEDRTVVASLHPDGIRLNLSVAVGAVPSTAPTAVFETLLTYNLAYESTGGVRMGLTNPGRQVHLIADFVAADLNPSSTAAIINNMREYATVWGAYLAASAQSPETSAPPPNSAGDSFMMRV